MALSYFSRWRYTRTRVAESLERHREQGEGPFYVDEGLLTELEVSYFPNCERDKAMDGVSP
jgi:hypothetical protein